MSAAMHHAVLRLAWRQRLNGARWQSLAVLTVMPVCLAILGAWLGWGWVRSLAACGLGLVGTLWHLQIEALALQNRPQLARQLPGQLRTLRQQLLLGAAAATLLGSLLLSVVARQPLLACLPLVALGLSALAWLARLPWFWAIAWLPLGALHELLARAVQLSSGELAVVLLGAWLVLLPLVGGGGAWHRRFDPLLRLTQTSPRPVAVGARWGAGRAFWEGLVRLLSWPLHAWRRRLERSAAPHNALARVDAWLSGSGHWSLQLWGVALMLLGGALLALVLAGSLPEVSLLRVLSNMGGLGIGMMAMLQVASTQKQQRLQATRREQALLVLLPGVPAGAGLGVAMRRRWVRQALGTSLLSMLLFGAVFLLSHRIVGGMAGALLAVLLFAPLLLLRDWSGVAKSTWFDQSGLMICAALLAAASLFQPWAGWWLPLLALPLALALFVFKWPEVRHYPSQFPVGRRYSGSSVK